MVKRQDYRESLRDGRATCFEGERVKGLNDRHVLGSCVTRVADEYDRLYSPATEAISPLATIPRSSQDLRDQIPVLHASGMMAHVTCTSIMTLTTAAG